MLATGERFELYRSLYPKAAVETVRDSLPANIMYEIDKEEFVVNFRVVTQEEVMKSEVGVRYDEGKVLLQDIPPQFEQMIGELLTEEPGLRVDLIPKEFIRHLARVYTEGARKYADRNWEKGLTWQGTLGALQRHILKWRRGLVFDPELKTHSLAMAAWGLAALIEFELTHPDLDDRNKDTMDLGDGKRG